MLPPTLPAVQDAPPCISGTPVPLVAESESLPVPPTMVMLEPPEELQRDRRRYRRTW